MNPTSIHSHFTPEGWHTVTPRIVVHGAEQMVDFAKHVFDATGDYRRDMPSVISIGDSMIMISEAGIRKPTSSFLYVYVEDTDETYRRALQAGARSLEEPAEVPYGDRRSMVEDQWGNTWQIATYLGGRNVSKKRRTSEENMRKIIIWRRIDLTGHEACRLYSQDTECHLEGTAVFLHDHKPAILSYEVVCDSNWNTLRARVSGWVANVRVDIDLVVDREHRWRLNAIDCPTLAGCLDLDLNFSPSTNLLPIRRLNLLVGQEAQVKAAWLRFPSFRLEPLPQVYRRVAESTYRYESGEGEFVADLKINSVGFVTNYPGLWQAEGSTAT